MTNIFAKWLKTNVHELYNLVATLSPASCSKEFLLNCNSSMSIAILPNLTLCGNYIFIYKYNIFGTT